MPLIIGETEEKALAAAMENARKKPLTIAAVMQAVDHIDQSTDVLTLEQRKAAPPKREPEQVLIPIGYRVMISFEEQPAGMCLHVSMSSANRGLVPHPEAIAMVLEALGLPPGSDGRTWIEEFEPGWHAVNVVVVTEPAKGGHA